MRGWGLGAAAVLVLAGCGGTIVQAPAGSFEFGSRTIPITRETATTPAPDGTMRQREWFFVLSNGERYNCDGTEADCRRVFRRAEESPRSTRSRR